MPSHRLETIATTQPITSSPGSPQCDTGGPCDTIGRHRGIGVHIEFGYQRDHGSWSDKAAVLGELRTGPDGLLQILETRCGVASRRVDRAQRIARMYRVLAEIDQALGWFHQSFATDGWATAGALLSVVDELREASIAASVLGAASQNGGQTKHNPTARPAVMIDLCDAATGVPGGDPDRFACVLEVLATPKETRLAQVADLHISVNLPYTLLPPIWRAVMTKLSACGSSVSFPQQAEHAGHGTPEVTLLHVQDEWEAAQYVCAYLAPLMANHAEGGTSDVGLLIEHDADALDNTLARHGLPQTGSAHASAARWHLQLLPALIATVWKPVNPQRIADFLMLATDLVPHGLGARIMHALEEHPGVGGSKWQEAIQQIRAAGGDIQADRLDRWFSTELFDEDEGIPLQALTERLGWLRSRLMARTEEHALARLVVAQSQELEQALAIVLPHDGARVPRRLLESVLHSVLRPTDVANEEGAAPWTIYRSIESVRGTTARLIWWNPVASVASATTRFTQAENAILASHGFAIETPADTRRRQRFHTERFLTAGPRELLLVLPTRLRGEPTSPHPLVSETQARGRGELSVIDTRELQMHAPLPGRSIALAPMPPETTGGAASIIRVEPGTVSFPDRLSSTTIRSLLGCPMQWVLNTHAKLGRTYGTALPTGNQMLGMLTHKIVETLATEHLEDGRLPASGEALAAKLFDRLLPEMAAELLLPGRRMQRLRHRRTVGRAIAALRDAIARLGLTVAHAEQFLDAPWKIAAGGTQITTTLVGLADLELQDTRSAPFVLDLKYSYGTSHYQQMVEDGEAVQLAVYAHLIEHNRGMPAIGTGYFLLPPGTLITSSALAGEQAVESVTTTKSLWNHTERSVAAALEELHRDGVVTVSGLLEQEPDTDATARRARAAECNQVYQEPPCEFCDFAVVCGRERGDA